MATGPQNKLGVIPFWYVQTLHQNNAHSLISVLFLQQGKAILMEQIFPVTYKDNKNGQVNC